MKYQKGDTVIEVSERIYNAVYKALGYKKYTEKKSKTEPEKKAEK